MDDDDDFDEDARPAPLDRREAATVRRDLDDLDAFRRLFEPEGFKGVSLFCADCQEEHFYGWDMLEGNLRALLEAGETPVHEPAFDPRPEEYVNWEYAQGYLDGQADIDVTPMVEIGENCPWCNRPLPPPISAVGFCPACGHDLAVPRILAALRGRGWSEEEISEVVAETSPRRTGPRRT